jgi:hypothetical protein
MKQLKRISLLSLSFYAFFSLPFVSDLMDRASWKVEQHSYLPKPEISRKRGLNELVYETAFGYLNTHKSKFKNKRYLTVIDYTRPSYQERMYIIDLQSGEVERLLVAHGKNSGLVMATDFSNVVDSLKSCKGFFVTGERYLGSHGTSLVLHGLEKGVNDNALKRRIVMHGADYVSRRSILLNGGRLGLSWGCPAVPIKKIDCIVEKIKDGSLLYIHAN